MLLSVIIFRDSEGKILLQFRDSNAKSWPLGFSLFGGLAENSESAMEALLREVKEELDLDLTSDDVTLLEETPWESGISGEKTVYFYEGKKPLAWEDFKIHEGAGAAFLTKEEILSMDNVSKIARYVVERHC